MHREREAFRELGAEPVLIGHSSLRYARRFVDETGVFVPVFVDEERRIYEAMNFKRSLLSFLSPKTFKRAAEARREGFTQPGVHGDAFQLGGVVLLIPDGSMPYCYASRFAGDHPKMENLKRAVRKAISER